MRIGIDYTAAVHQGGGIGRLTRNLIRALSELDADNDYRLFVAAGRAEDDGLGAWPANFRSCSLPLSDRWLHILWQRLRLPIPVQAITGPLDLFHSPDFVLPPTGRTPAILTVHDLSFMRLPQFFVPGFRRYLEGAVKRAVSRARYILADSESTRRDLIELLGANPQRIAVLYPGVEPRFRPVGEGQELARVKARYDLPDRFVLGLSTLQPRKNFEGLIAAFGRLLAERGGEPGIADLHLVIVGGKGWMYEDLLSLAERKGFGVAAGGGGPGGVAGGCGPCGGPGFRDRPACAGRGAAGALDPRWVRAGATISLAGCCRPAFGDLHSPWP